MRSPMILPVFVCSSLVLACAEDPTQVPLPGTAQDSSAGGVTSAPTDVGTESGQEQGDSDSTGPGSGSTGPDAATDSTGASSISGGMPQCTGQKVVHMVYFVEADQVFSEQQRSDIEGFAFEFQQYWYEQLGATFYLGQPVVDVIMADHDSDWYVQTPDGIHTDPRWYRLGNIKNEVYAKLGIVDFDPDHRVVSYPIARVDGRVGVNFGGAWMDGDDMTCIAGDGPTFPYGDDGPAHCMGHVAHEVGHVLGLGHEGPNDDCMQLGFYDSVGGRGMCDFSPDNVASILANPDNAGWLDAQPGDTCRPVR